MANSNLSYAVPTLPFDLISEILSRLSVKLLLQFRCVCKFWNSLISDHKFARKHFKLSTTHNLHVTSCDYSLDRFVLKSYSLQTLFIDTTTNFTQLEFPFKCIHQHNNVYYIVGSCHGILCLSDYLGRSVKLWNPSIRKFKELPLFENSHHELDVELRYGFGYDYVSDNYKVVVLYNSFHIDNTKAKIHTLGTDSWRSIQMFPYLVYFSDDDQLGSGRYVSDTINWLAYTSLKIPPFIISFDMDKESCQKILLPKHVETNVIVPQLYVLKDCLCIITYNDLWIMKEYGNKESWTKLFKVHSMPLNNDFSRLTKALYIFKDDQVLLEYWKSIHRRLILSDKNGTFKVISTMFRASPEICIESLISP